MLARLTPEFSTLTASKLRFLENQGIVTPTRTESGYRKFSNDDVERLRAALTLQRDHYLPLARICEYLDEYGPEAPQALNVPTSIIGGPRRYRRDELLTEADASPALLNDAVTAGLIVAAETYDDGVLATLRTLVALNSNGIQPRHLRSVRQAAERDVALIENALAPLLRRAEAAPRAQAGMRAAELARNIDELRHVFTQAAIDRLTP